MTEADDYRKSEAADMLSVPFEVVVPAAGHDLGEGHVPRIDLDDGQGASPEDLACGLWIPICPERDEVRDEGWPDPRRVSEVAQFGPAGVAACDDADVLARVARLSA